ncbi:MtrAB system histidine kinase MtrB [Gulosibacter bifidus]|uniref:Sensor histidine kinase MtrB n=1 Tax=Gulosibacter bifidus TaxID=272239 RepID=A0ABW5RK72_9MICO|nr:MtrAB system histidine kinase MtrB [Gulosibacter bifidus]
MPQDASTASPEADFAAGGGSSTSTALVLAAPDERIPIKLSRSTDEFPDRDLPGSWWRPAGLFENLKFLWATSLPFRTTLIAVLLTSATVIAVALVMGNTIARDLYTSRIDDLQVEAERAVAAAQSKLDLGGDSGDQGASSLRQEAITAAQSQTPNSIGFAFYSPPSQNNNVGLQDMASETVPLGLVSEKLREAVRAQTGPVHYQSVALAGDLERIVPGVVIGSTVSVPGSGYYEFYLVYSLEESQDTLDFIQRTLVISMAILVLLVALITGAIMRAVIQPIRLAAQTSRKLAAGHLEERIPERGEDDIGTLSRSFNHMADNLQEQIEQLEHLSKVQQRFVSDVSHELRTPLTTIRLAGGIVYARKNEFDPTLARSAELLHDQVERFELLLNDLLEISRYDAGAVELLRRSNDLKDIAEDVVGAMLPVAMDHSEALLLRVPEREVRAEFDDRRIRRIVRNLIANAIEHGEGQPIVVTVDANATAVALSVRDYGIGMNEDHQKLVFERFWRADPSRKRTMGGSGLGLAISHEDARLHDGKLEVWSALGLGTNFRLTLPVRVGEPIVSSPLPLLPEDAGSETFVGDYADDQLGGTNLSTQPQIIQLAAVDADTDAETAADASDTITTQDTSDAPKDTDE